MVGVSGIEQEAGVMVGKAWLESHLKKIRYFASAHKHIHLGPPPGRLSDDAPLLAVKSPYPALLDQEDWWQCRPR
ncbi:hypothetical protein PIB30_097910 [Stylosanthes scabra]|uniref:Uncharacterized protein n=1 Tax=Stylosanthes scabra TaxID=79078 RepID=A0ABU6SX23_9FABA|nr:hypothetical protein [Stylosanthes scabra]